MPSPTLPSRDLFIGGEWRPAAGGATYTSRNPVDDSPITDIADAQPEDVDAAVAAAQHAFDHSGWVEMGGAERGRILYAAADAIAADAENISALETLEVGKLYRDGLMGDLPATLATFRYYAGAADKLLGSTVQLPDYAGRHRLNYTLREPLGVVGAITPWNNPIVVAGWKIAPALAAGNSIVVKPPEDAALSLLRLAEILAEVGVPAGVFNVIPGIGEVAGAALAQHPGLAKLSFTGSPEVGATMSNHAGGQFRKVTLELGGKNPQIVFPDADLDGAMPFIAVGNFLHQGQVCAAGTRVYAHESLVDEVVDRLADHAKQITLGDPFDETVGMGPVINETALTKIMGYVDSGSSEGASLITGGHRADREGWFVEPTVFVGQQHQRIAREEIFGPVATVIPFSTTDEAFALANDTHFGLNAIVYTESLNLAQRAARELKVGNVWINAFGIPDMTTPWGGRAGSGLGRELGAAGIESYTEEKTVQMMF
jgi:acyl-CoA reductase-like NAD-dependent aldehyde dehydrogenase